MEYPKQLKVIFFIFLNQALLLGFIIALISYLFTSTTDITINEMKRVFYAPGLLVILSPGYVLAGPWLASYSDTIGRRQILIFCTSLAVIGLTTILYNVFTVYSLAVLFATLLLSFSVCAIPILKAALIDVLPDKLLTILVPCGLSLFLTKYWIYLGLYIMESNIISVSHLTAGCLYLSLINWLLIFFLFKETNSNAHKFYRRRLYPQVYFHLLKAITKPPLCYWLSIFCLLNFSWALYQYHLVSNFEGSYLAMQFNNKLFLIIKVAIILAGAWLLCRQKDHRSLNLSRWFNVSMSLLAFGLIGEHFAQSDMLRWLISLPVNFGAEISIILSAVITISQFDRRHIGLYLGLFSSLWTLVFIIGCYTAHFLHEDIPSILAFFAILLLLLYIVYLLRKKLHFTLLWVK